jgi:hypothetical protein
MTTGSLEIRIANSKFTFGGEDHHWQNELLLGIFPWGSSYCLVAA